MQNLIIQNDKALVIIQEGFVLLIVEDLKKVVNIQPLAGVITAPSKNKSPDTDMY